MRLYLSEAARRVIEGSAEAADSKEDGGLLLGFLTSAEIVVTRAVPVEDPRATQTSYTRIEALAQKALDAALTQESPDVGYVGDWHTHPGPTGASSRDLETVKSAATELGMPVGMVVASVRGSKARLHSYVLQPDSSHDYRANGTTHLSAERVEPPPAAARDMTQRMSIRRFLSTLSRYGLAIYLALVGSGLIGTAWLMRESQAAAASLALLGASALIIAPFANRIEGTLRIGALEFSLRRRFRSAAESAPLEELEGLLPILESESISAVPVRLPQQFEGVRLIDDDLAFLRKDLKLGAVAVLFPGEARWRAGGEISDHSLPAGSILALVGPTLSVQELVEARGWQRVSV